MRTVTLEWGPFFEGKVIPKSYQENKRVYMGAAAGGLGIAEALEPFKMIIAECSDPVCFVGGAMGLYRIGLGQREEGFKQVLNATLAQVGFFVWPKLQAAVRVGLGG